MFGFAVSITRATMGHPHCTIHEHVHTPCLWICDTYTGERFYLPSKRSAGDFPVRATKGRKKIKISFYLYLRHLFKVIRKWPWCVSRLTTVVRPGYSHFKSYVDAVILCFGLLLHGDSSSLTWFASWQPPLREAEGHRAPTNVHTDALSLFPLICTIFPNLRSEELWGGILLPRQSVSAGRPSLRQVFVCPYVHLCVDANDHTD